MTFEEKLELAMTHLGRSPCVNHLRFAIHDGEDSKSRRVEIEHGYMTSDTCRWITLGVVGAGPSLGSALDDLLLRLVVDARQRAKDAEDTAHATSKAAIDFREKAARIEAVLAGAAGEPETTDARVADFGAARFAVHRCSLARCQCLSPGQACPTDITSCVYCPQHSTLPPHDWPDR